MVLAARPASATRPADRCCVGQCAYAVETVRWHLDRLLDFERAGESVGRFYTAPSHDRFGGAPGEGETALIDVRRIVEQLRAEGQPVTADAVSARLCPWSSDACD